MDALGRPLATVKNWSVVAVVLVVVVRILDSSDAMGRRGGSQWRLVSSDADTRQDGPDLPK